MIWIIIILGVVIVGQTLAWLLYRGNNRGVLTEESLKREYTAQLEKLNAMHKAELEAQQRFFAEQRKADAEARQREIAAINAGAESRFKELATLLMQEGSRQLGKNNKEQLDAILSPLKERITEFHKAVEEAAAEDKISRHSFREKIDELVKLNVSLGKEADNLATALRGRNKVQGDWGETVLRTLLEQGGLTSGIHFQEQLTTDTSGATLRNEDGKGLRPDVVVNLPDNRRLVIDSKVTLTAWLDFCEASEKRDQQEASERLVKSVKKHIDELAAKRYQDYIGVTPDFVVMFIPIEGAYIAALQNDSELWNYAWHKKVAISSPTHLFAIMHSVKSLWTAENRNNNALKIAEKAGALYDKLLLFMESFDTLGKSLGVAQEEYEKTLSRLSTGKGNLVKSAQELNALGVNGKGRRSIPLRFGDGE